jgi:hypothetical protein
MMEYFIWTLISAVAVAVLIWIFKRLGLYSSGVKTRPAFPLESDEDLKMALGMFLWEIASRKAPPPAEMAQNMLDVQSSQDRGSTELDFMGVD